LRDNSIGPYTIVRLIRGGGQGQVYLGYDRRLQRQVAIKIHLLPRSRMARKAALAEARRAARMNCPQVVQIYDLIESSDHLAIVMEYVPGVDLEELLQIRHLGVASILTIAMDVAAALAAARRQKIVHGDLKASNVLITTRGRAKLTDFGIARDQDDGGLARGGSYSALSPEHFDGTPLDVRSDLFSLGCLLYLMLAREQAFFRDGQFDAQLLLAERRPDLMSKLPREEAVPEALSQLVNQLLKRDPDDRPANTHPVRRQLRSALKCLPLTQADSLLREASAHFRPESPEDVPLGIPAQLREKGRSTLGNGWSARLGRHLRALRPSTRVALGVAGLACVGIPIALAMQERPTRVHFENPDIHIESMDELPPQLSQRWLMDQVYAAVAAEIGPLQASGAVRSRAYYAQLAEHEPAFVVHTSLRCSHVLCVFTVSRDRQGNYGYRQATISPMLPETVWVSAITESTRGLFR
jgi:eukaryotic-like serine/threonine-protein kinase